jgi:glycerol-3-phosphate dehydrogenase
MYFFMESNFSKSKTSCDVLILGAGIIGLSIGVALLESRPGIKVIISEKEKTLARHSSGRNSGVLHAGFYYSPDSLKARFCKDGNFEIRQLAKKYNIPVKIIVINNSYQMMVKLWQDKFFNKNHVGVKMNNPEFHNVVQAMGARALEIRDNHLNQYK